MRAASSVALAVAVSLGLSSAVLAQDIPDAPIPAGPVPTGGAVDVAPAVPPTATGGTPAAAYAAYDQVEVEDPVEPGFWDKCTVIEAFQGAYEVSCNHTRSIRRDIHVRPIGGRPVSQTAAKPVTGAPFTRGSIVLASVMGLPDDWRLCIVQRNNVATTNGYEIQCAGSRYVVLPRWLRVDPKAPAA